MRVFSLIPPSYLVAGRIVYLLSISQLGATLFAKLRGRKALAFSDTRTIIFGVGGAIVLQFVFSQWSMMNVLFGTASLNLTQWLICLLPALPMISVALLVNRIDRFD
ncbi:cation transporting ATPase C-terminal domain-containing protein [Phormidesmis sp. 146-35]